VPKIFLQGKPTSFQKQYIASKIIRPVEITSEETISEYRQAISRAVNISLERNTVPIPGRTLVLVDGCDEMDTKQPVKKSFLTSLWNVATSLAVLLNKACEASTIMVFSGGQAVPVEFTNAVKTDVAMLAEKRCSLDVHKGFPFAAIRNMIATNDAYDLILVLSNCSLILQPFQEGEQTLKGVMEEYRAVVRPSAKLVTVDLYPQAKGSKFESYQNLVINGWHENILKELAALQMLTPEFVEQQI
jgi:hypothetical protein